MSILFLHIGISRKKSITTYEYAIAGDFEATIATTPTASVEASQKSHIGEALHGDLRAGDDHTLPSVSPCTHVNVSRVRACQYPGGMEDLETEIKQVHNNQLPRIRFICCNPGR